MVRFPERHNLVLWMTALDEIIQWRRTMRKYRVLS
jgi:hypothetical protein